jgi:hypothetical protein
VFIPRPTQGRIVVGIRCSVEFCKWVSCYTRLESNRFGEKGSACVVVPLGSTVIAPITSAAGLEQQSMIGAMGDWMADR